MTYANEIGSKYDCNMSRKDLKAAILGELKAAVKAGILPKCKLSLRARSYNAYYVTVSQCSFKILNPERVRLDETDSRTFVPECHCPRLTAEASRVISRIEAIAAEYNFDHSDIQTDYFHVNFYFHVEFKQAEVDAERRAIIDAASPIRREIASLTRSAFQRLDYRLENALKPLEAWQCSNALQFAAMFDRTFGITTDGLHAQIADLQAQLAQADDWSVSQGEGVAA